MNCFEIAICNEIDKFFDENNIAYNKKVKNFNSKFNQYMNVLNKRVDARKRKVHLSEDLKAKLASLDEKEKNLVEIFKNKFINGEDINGHLSRKIYDADFYDKLLIMWGIYHIHLNDIEADTYDAMKLNRADKLLFAVIREDDVYFIDIERHNKDYVFSMFNLLKIIKNNWEFLLYEHKDITDVEHAVYDDKTLYELFKAKINYFIYKIDGKFYSIGLNGQTSAGTSMINQLKFMQLQRCLDKIYPKPPKYATQIKCTLKYSVDYFCDLDWMEGKESKHFTIRATKSL